MDLELRNKVALITGAASGFGSAIARALVEEGCAVCLADINLSAVEQTKVSLGKATHAVEMDVGNASDVRAKIDRKSVV